MESLNPGMQGPYFRHQDSRGAIAFCQKCEDRFPSAFMPYYAYACNPFTCKGHNVFISVCSKCLTSLSDYELDEIKYNYKFAINCATIHQSKGGV